MSVCSSLISGSLYLCAVLGLIIKYVVSLICCFGPSRRVIGIFSRSSPDDYQWITDGLKSPMFKHLVAEVRSIYISNRDVNLFRQATHECDFAVLYHTKNRGRINITNVTDSIYDMELKYLSGNKGRENVIVVVDDMEKSDYEDKYRIQLNQPDIMNFSHDLILVSQNEKMQPQIVNTKLQQIKDLIAAGSWGSVDFVDYLVRLYTNDIYDALGQHQYKLQFP